MKFRDKIKNWLNENWRIFLLAGVYGGLYYLRHLIALIPPREGLFFWNHLVMGVIEIVHGIPLLFRVLIIMVSKFPFYGPYLSSNILSNVIMIAILGFVILYSLKIIWSKGIHRRLVIFITILQLVGAFTLIMGSSFVGGREVICEQFSSDREGVRIIGYEHYILFGGTSLFKMETNDGGKTWEQASYKYYDDIIPSYFVDRLTDSCEISW